MNDLVEELSRLNSQITGCKLCAFLQTRSKSETATLQTALENRAVQHTTIADILTKYGYSVSEAAVRRHRKAH